MRRNLLFVSVLALLAGCSGGSVAPLPTAAQLRAVPLSLGVSGKTLKGETFLWRDLMPTITEPGSPAPKRGVIVLVTVKAEDNTVLPSGLSAEKLTITNGDEVWASSEVELRGDANSFGGVVRNGPEWAVGSSVDVVVDLRSTEGTQQLRAVGQIVQGVY